MILQQFKFTVVYKRGKYMYMMYMIDTLSRAALHLPTNDHHRGEQWGHSEVLGAVTPRSYVIKTQNGLVRRNRIHLRPKEPQVPCDPQPLPEQLVIDSGVDIGNSAETIVPNPNSESPNENSLRPVQTSRYGRPIRSPKRLDL